jgi:hypothetical protein
MKNIILKEMSVQELGTQEQSTCNGGGKKPIEIVITGEDGRYYVEIYLFGMKITG